MESTNNLYTIEWATIDRVSEVLSFMYENFDKEEIVLNSLRRGSTVTTELEDQMRLDHERLMRAIFSFSPCVIATEKSAKNIIGANLMIVSQNPKFNPDGDGVSAAFSSNPPTTQIMKQYFAYLSDIGESADLFGKFPKAKSAVEFYAVAVDKSYRKMGISRSLMAAGISFAKDSIEDAGFVFGVYTSLYSKKAAERLGLKPVLDVDLLTYRDDNGRLIFQDTPPHNVVSVMVMEIERVSGTK